MRLGQMLLRNPHVEELCICAESPVSRDTLSLVCAIIGKLSTLKELHFEFTDDSAPTDKIMHTIETNKKIEVIVVSASSSPRCIIDICKGIKNSTSVVEIRVAIPDADVERHVIDIIDTNQTVRTIHMHYVHLTDMASMCAAISRNDTVNEIYISFFGTSMEMAKNISKMISLNKTLTTLSLSTKSMGASEFSVVCRGLLCNISLRRLRFFRSICTDPMHNAIRDTARINKTVAIEFPFELETPNDIRDTNYTRQSGYVINSPRQVGLRSFCITRSSYVIRNISIADTGTIIPKLREYTKRLEISGEKEEVPEVVPIVKKVKMSK